MANNHYELDRAHMESIRNEFEDAYFKARPQIDTMDRRRVFQASFERAWQAACKYKDETPSKIDALRGQLQNCANLLRRLKRLGRAGDATAADAAIDSANRVLHETLCK